MRYSWRIKTTNINYYLNKGYSQKEAEQMLHDRQNTTSLESYIKRYGEAKGTKRFQERNEKWLDSLKKYSEPNPLF